MRKNPCDSILRGEPNEQYLGTVPKSCPYIIKCIFSHLKYKIIE